MEVRLDHIGIAVRDIDAALATWSSLGLCDAGGEVLPERGLEVRFLALGDTRVELLRETREDSEISRFLAQRGAGIHHLCLAVADLDVAVASVEARGGRMATAISKGADGRRVAFVHPKSNHGVLLELAEVGDAGN
jgi:methylmalonyl-CoA/ethylmalonyl-CoA epimerase